MKRLLTILLIALIPQLSNAICPEQPVIVGEVQIDGQWHEIPSSEYAWCGTALTAKFGALFEPGSTISDWIWQWSDDGVNFVQIPHTILKDNFVSSEDDFLSFTYTSDKYIRLYKTSGECSGLLSDNIIHLDLSGTNPGGSLNSVTVCEGDNALLTLTGYTGTIIQWESRLEIDESWQVIGNAGMATLTVPNFIDAKTQYRVLVQGNECNQYSTTGSIEKFAIRTIGSSYIENWNNSGTLSITGNSPVLHWEKSLDDGQTWTNLGFEGSNIYNYSGVNDKSMYRAVVDGGICGEVKSIPATLLIIADNSGYHTSENKIFDENGKVISASKSYSDALGRVRQSQSKDFVNNEVFATQPVYDKRGKPTMATLPAPINSSEFSFRDDFVLAPDGQPYDASNFDTPQKQNAPDPVLDDGPGTLGWYYNNEPGVSKTSYPYTQSWVEPHPEPKLSKSAGVGEQFRMGSGHVVEGRKTEWSEGELQHYWSLRQLFVTETIPPVKKGDKYISKDPDGFISESYTDISGQGIVSNYIDLTYWENALGKNIETLNIPGMGDATLPVDFYVSFETEKLPQDEINPQGLFFRNQNGTSSNALFFEDGNYTVHLAPGIYTISKSYVKDFRIFRYPIGERKGFTYNYYNDLGRLEATILPGGVEWSKQPGNEGQMPPFTIRYEYDHHGWLTSVNDPDAGISEYIYDRDGRIRFSENAKQKANGTFSYSTYDKYGRPLESGEYIGTTSDFTTLKTEDEILIKKGYSEYGSSDRKDWNEVYYDFADPNFFTATGLPSEYEQTNLLGAVSYTKNQNITTWYSYDEEGTLLFMAQKPTLFNEQIDEQNPSPPSRVFISEYSYLYTGEVDKVSFKAFVAGEMLEQFHHHYEYDIDGRLTRVLTSLDGNIENAEEQANYSYYLHGPMKRIVLAENLQGIDFTYTTQGALKAINHVSSSLDPGGDGPNGILEDAFAMTFDYYDGDYTGTIDFGYSGINKPDQFDGSIRSVAWGRGGEIPPIPGEDVIELNSYESEKTNVVARKKIILGPGFTVPDGSSFSGEIDPDHSTQNTDGIETFNQVYSYDSKKQLTEAEFGKVVNTFYEPDPNDAFNEGNLSYDANGNIQTLTRKGKEGEILHDFQYIYEENTNRLIEITGYATYQYDEIGQLVAEIPVEGDPMYYRYDVSGLVTEVCKDEACSTKLATFLYDDRGFRLMKKNEETGEKTWYIRDASGTLLSIYLADGQNTPVWFEVPVYAGSRIATYFPLYDGTTSYEITDHQGSVRALLQRLRMDFKATMEDSGEDCNSTNNNPRCFELQAFRNIEETAAIEEFAGLNHTASTTAVHNPNKVAYLNSAEGVSIGPAIMMEVKQGDRISLKAFAKYEKPAETGKTDFLLTDIAGAVGQTFEPTTEGITFVQNAVEGAFSLFPYNSVNTEVSAYLNYIIFDYNYTALDAGNDPVSEAAGYTVSPVEVEFDELGWPEIVIEQDGYIYAYVSNETAGRKVFFDDFQINVERDVMIQTSDYYPGGMVMREVKRDMDDIYRFAYQGQYAEVDQETQKTAFQLRMYDPVIMRWGSVDPYGQFASGYVGMGNSPHSGVDPDGGKFNWTTAAIGAGIGAAVGAGYALATGQDNWGLYALGGAIGGGLLGGASFTKKALYGLGGSESGSLGGIVGHKNVLNDFGRLVVNSSSNLIAYGGDDILNYLSQEEKKIDLGNSSSGQEIADYLKKYYKKKKVDRKTKPPYLEDFVDVTSSFTENFGYGSVVGKTSGYRYVNKDRFKITIFKRGEFGKPYSTGMPENQIRGGRLEELNINGERTYRYKITNQNTKASIIVFETKNLEAIHRIRNHLMN